MTRTLCLHCRRKKSNRPRGLCWDCYYTPGVKALYPSTSKYANRGLGLGNRTPPAPPAPASLQPGSAEKLALLIARQRSGFGLWHPADAPPDLS
jgi:hypothetical protein